jgi:hypothetical protein
MSDATPTQKKRRNWAVLAALVVFVLMVYGVTIVRIGMHHGAQG